MTGRAAIVCRRCHGDLARIRPATGRVTPLPGVVSAWDGPARLVLICPACRTERVVTVGEERAAA